MGGNDRNNAAASEADLDWHSHSQARVTKKGTEAHEAEFMAFPVTKMWGYYLYFGARVR